MKKSILSAGFVIIFGIFALNASKKTEADHVEYICADVTFTCGATGRICGADGDGFIARYNEANAEVCGNQ